MLNTAPLHCTSGGQLCYQHRVDLCYRVCQRRDPVSKRGTLKFRINTHIAGVIFFLHFTRKLVVSSVSIEQGFPYLTALLMVKSNHHDMEHRSLQVVSALRFHPPLMSRQPPVCFELGVGWKHCKHSQIYPQKSMQTGKRKHRTVTAEISSASSPCAR